MTNLKKIGLTALAGTLAATTFAQAGTVDVTAKANMEYETNKATNKLSDDTFFQNKSVTFSGSGELDNGFGVSMYHTFDEQVSVESSVVTLDMNDMGKITMDYFGYVAGLASVQDVVPNAGEQVWDDTGSGEHGTPAAGVTNPQADGSGHELGYTVSANGITLSTTLAFAGDHTEESAVIMADGLVEGLMIGAGAGTNQNATTQTQEDDLTTYFVKYTTGPISVGAQQSEVDTEAAGNSVERTAYGISFAVNENLSISYGQSDVDFDASTTDEESKGFSASYTSGGMTVGLVRNEKDNVAGTVGDNEEVAELKLTFAF
jgi:outer membrane protein OmpU